MVLKLFLFCLHVLQQVFSTLDQDDPLEWRVFTHHSTHSISTNHKLQQGQHTAV